MAAWVESVGATDYGIFGGQTKKNEGRNPACEEDLLQIALLNRDFGIKYNPDVLFRTRNFVEGQYQWQWLD